MNRKELKQYFETVLKSGIERDGIITATVNGNKYQFPTGLKVEDLIKRSKTSSERVCNKRNKQFQTALKWWVELTKEKREMLLPMLVELEAKSDETNKEYAVWRKRYAEIGESYYESHYYVVEQELKTLRDKILRFCTCWNDWTTLIAILPYLKQYNK